MSRPFNSRHSAGSNSYVRVNGKIRAREVRLIDDENKQLGVVPLSEALNMARARAVDLVEVAPNAVPPVCKLVDYGKYRYEQAKKEKESKKHQHATKVKEVQLSPKIDPHDFQTKLDHAIDFLCNEMKVKVVLRFRGREMAHQEVGFAKIHAFIKAVTPFGHPDSPAKMIGKGINLMLSPLPRNKRAKNPREGQPALEELPEEPEFNDEDDEGAETEQAAAPVKVKSKKKGKSEEVDESAETTFENSPFKDLLEPK